MKIRRCHAHEGNFIWNVALFGALLVALFSGTLEAQPNPEQRPFFQGNGEGSAGGRRGVLRELGLTPDQITEIKAARNREASQQMRSELKAGREKLRQMVHDRSVSDDAILAQARQLHQQQGTLMEARLKGILAVRKILSPEQFGKLHELMEQRRAERRSGMASRLGAQELPGGSHEPGGNFAGRRLENRSGLEAFRLWRGSGVR